MIYTAKIVIHHDKSLNLDEVLDTLRTKLIERAISTVNNQLGPLGFAPIEQSEESSVITFGDPEREDENTLSIELTIQLGDM